MQGVWAMLNGISGRSKKGLKRDKPEQSGTVTEPERTEPARGRGHSENIKSKAWHRAGEVSIRKLPSETLTGDAHVLEFELLHIRHCLKELMPLLVSALALTGAIPWPYEHKTQKAQTS